MLERGLRLGLPRRLSDATSDRQPCAIVISAWAAKLSLASLPGPLRANWASGSVVD